MRPVSFTVGLLLLSVGCTTTKPTRDPMDLRPPKVEEFQLPPATDQPLEPPAYPEEKKTIQDPRKNNMPDSMKNAGGSPGGMRGAGGGAGMGSGGGPGGPQ
ncbi:hypothetical protein KIH39_05100 [Telmatocola sphagniphila]|uniref:Lipoprotein n=1 Tax=Telmatocola sphagniphila TaxID=1123043 RepID=A0A8E6EVW0_9BACT|nr:hypothetical protein [Telmatocola sphagniphila]QVL33295.1 hypothetical protein KIH39_05100 [Telmatocola sphagniphila]